MIETRRRALRLALLLASLLVIYSCVPATVLAQERGIEITEPYKAATIRVQAEFADGLPVHGFGLIVGERDNKYIAVTAAHVLEMDYGSDHAGPAVEPRQIMVEFYYLADRDEPVSARRIAELPVLDVALLELPKLDFEVPFQTHWCDRFEQSENVWYIGRRQRWYVPADRDAGEIVTAAPDPLGRIQVSIDGVEPGSSGAPLIGAYGFLGMIIKATGTSSEVVSADSIRRFVIRQGNPWQRPACLGSAVSDSESGTELPEQGEKALKVFHDRLSSGFKGPPMVVIPEGRFLMGCESDTSCRDVELPRRWVSVDTFAMGKTEVTYLDYDRFTKATGRALPKAFHTIRSSWGGRYTEEWIAQWGWPRVEIRGLHPVTDVSWHDAVAYANWLTEETGFRYRVPSEAEWEYATRAGTDTKYWTGDCIDTDKANFDGRHRSYECDAGAGELRGRTVEAGSLSANPWGLYEVTGNVSEWVADCWHRDYNGAPEDARPWLEDAGGDCEKRVIRGGYYRSKPFYIRSADRSPLEVSKKSGFRVARDL